MAILCLLLVMGGMVFLDMRGKLDLGHPVVLLLWTAACLVLMSLGGIQIMLELLDLLQSRFSLVGWLGAGAALMGAPLFGVYALLRVNLRPVRREDAPSWRKAARLLDCGLMLGVPFQTLLIGGYLAVGLSIGAAVNGPFWMIPFYPLVALVLWPMAHLVFHVALAALVIDPFLLLAAGIIGCLWMVQEIFLVHGTVRGCLALQKSGGNLLLRVLLTLLPVAGLISAIHIRLALRNIARRGAFVPNA